VVKTILARLLPRDGRSAFLLGFGLSLAISLAIHFVGGPLLGMSQGFGGFAHDGYLELGASIARGHGFVFEPGGPPCTHRPPLTPVLLAPITRLPLAWQRPALILMHGLMVGLTLCLLFDLARKAFDARIAGVAVGLMIAYPWLFRHVKTPVNLIVQMTCAMLVVYLIGTELLESHARGKSVLSRHWFLRAGLLGLAGAAGILTHGTMLLSVPVLLLGMAAIGLAVHRRQVAAVAVVAGIVAVVAVSPWTYRNWKVCHRFVPVATGAGLQYLCGNVHWGFDDRFTKTDEEWRRALGMAGVYEERSRVVHFWGWKDPDLDRQANRKMVEDVRSDPARFAAKLGLNAVDFYLPSVHDLVARTSTKGRVVAHLAISVWHSVYWGLAVFGLWALRRSRLGPRLWLALGAIAALVVFYLPFVAWIPPSGYVLQTLPLLSVLASLGLFRVAALADTRRRSRSDRVCVFQAAPHFDGKRREDRSPAPNEALLPAGVDCAGP